jgi:uncharacterized membrane protein
MYTHQRKLFLLQKEKCLTMKGMKQRSLLIDLTRVMAIGLMIVYHAAFDVQMYWNWDIDVFQGGWYILERITASSFLLLVGISFAISWKATPISQKYWRRGLQILGYGFIVSIVTYVLDPETYVRFGILHLIGIATVLLPLAARLERWNAILGICCIAAGSMMTKSTLVSPVLLPLGIMPGGFRSVDYFPIFPWIGVIFLGAALGSIHLSRPLPEPSLPRRLAKVITAVSKKSLIIYMLHQPVLIALLRIILGKSAIAVIPFR